MGRDVFICKHACPVIMITIEISDADDLEELMLIIERLDTILDHWPGRNE